MLGFWHLNFIPDQKKNPPKIWKKIAIDFFPGSDSIKLLGVNPRQLVTYKKLNLTKKRNFQL